MTFHDLVTVTKPHAYTVVSGLQERRVRLGYRKRRHASFYTAVYDARLRKSFISEYTADNYFLNSYQQRR